MTDITLPRSVVEKALEALKYERDANNPLDWYHDKTMTALRAALEQPQVEQEPVAYRHMHEDGWEYYDAPTGSDCDECQPLYTHPQNLRCKSTQARLATLWGYEKKQPPRQPLTDDEVWGIWNKCAPELAEFARAIERAHGIGGEV